ncbi:MAG TPA: trigger factor [Synergistaceae bacterium]|nr:trigger factor [Synergistaceae bacterium]HQF90510.1 trigger factor [Synergistaceae bacterium]HQH77504.1 trigger factor [Synergistaceae bacterium]HQK24769.1 trigger factor [Synergistaceae bacterium]
MRSEIVSQENTTVVLHVEVEQERFDGAVRDAVREMSRNVELKGFRKGHVPRRALDMYFGSRAIVNEALEELMPRVVNELAEEYDLAPIESPSFNFISAEEGKPLVVDITLEVRPEVTLPPLEEIEVDKPLIDVAEDDVEKAMDEFRRVRATMASVEGRPAGEGDTVMVSYTATVEGEEDPVETNTSPIALGAPQLRKEIRDVLMGREKGDEVDVMVSMEEDANPRYAGRNVRYHFVVTDIQEEILPELTDETVPQLTSGAAKTVEELRRRMRRRLESEVQSRVDMMVRNEAFDQLVAKASVASLPEKSVLRHMNQLRQDDLEELRRQGKEDLEEVLRAQGKDLAAYDQGLRERGEALTRNGFVIDVLADQNQIEVSQEDLEMEFRRVALRTGTPLKKVYEQYTQRRDLLGELMAALRTRKTLDHLVSKVAVREMPMEEYRGKHGGFDASGEGNA